MGLLLSIHKFFDKLGAEEIRRRGAREDKPLRMVKTVLHEVRLVAALVVDLYMRPTATHRFSLVLMWPCDTAWACFYCSSQQRTLEQNCERRMYNFTFAGRPLASRLVLCSDFCFQCLGLVLHRCASSRVQTSTGTPGTSQALIWTLR